MAGTKRSGLFDVVFTLLIAASAGAGGLWITHYLWLRGPKYLSLCGGFFVGLGLWFMVLALRSRRSSESRALVRTVSDHLGDVLSPQGRIVDYRRPGRVRPNARELYARDLPSAPLPPDTTRPGRVLPHALGMAAGSDSPRDWLAIGVTGTVMSLGFVFLARGHTYVCLLLLGLTLGIAPLVSVVRRLLRRMKLVVVEVSDEPLFVGDTLRVHIEQRGPAKITRVQVGLSCRERATYGDGSGTRTEENEVLSFTLLDDRVPFALIRGQHKAHDLEVTIPPEAPASFRAKMNNVAWLLRVQAETAGWLDYDEIYEIRVVPAPPL